VHDCGFEPFEFADFFDDPLKKKVACHQWVVSLCP
jgi:hypothetical protein